MSLIENNTLQLSKEIKGLVNTYESMNIIDLLPLISSIEARCNKIDLNGFHELDLLEINNKLLEPIDKFSKTKIENEILLEIKKILQNTRCAFKQC